MNPGFWHIICSIERLTLQRLGRSLTNAFVPYGIISAPKHATDSSLDKEVLMGKPNTMRNEAEILRATSLAIEGLSYQAAAEVMEKTAEQVEGKVKVGLRRIGMSLLEARRDKDVALQLLKQRNH